MFLSKLKASSIAEVVIAISIIALCFGIVSLIFIRLFGVTNKYRDLKHQTEIQSQILELLFIKPDSIPLKTSDEIKMEVIPNEINTDYQKLQFKTKNGKLIFEQQIFSPIK